LEFITAFYGCLLAGMVAVPTYLSHSKQAISRLRAIATDAQASLILTTTSQFTQIEPQLAQHPDLAVLPWLTTDDLFSDPESERVDSNLRPETLAFIQYTSGSTSSPKGVMISHQNLLHNLAQIDQGFGHTPHSKGVIWLPSYHDMGLVGGILQPLYGGFPVVLIPPVAFLQKPFRWLQTISEHRATTSGGPNFAYELCVRKVTPQQKATLDLSSWEVAFNGAEFVRAETLEQFATTFEPCGFRREAFYPCYGMAEAT
jgi:acyl-CoA synthetase (AMP-forming)/AMP-acid ligase II